MREEKRGRGREDEGAAKRNTGRDAKRGRDDDGEDEDEESNLTEYDPLDLDDIDDMDEEVQKAGGNEFLKLGAGTHTLRVLPAQKGSGRKPFLLVHEHFINLPGRKKPMRFACARNMSKGKKKCPACDEADDLRRSGNPADADRAEEMQSNMRFYCNVINRKRPEEGPKIWPFGRQVWKFIKELTKASDGGDVTDPTKNGFDIIVTREGTGKNDTEYSVRPARKSSPLGDMEWIGKQWNLEKYAVLPDYDELYALMQGEDTGRGRGGRGRVGRAEEPRRIAASTRRSRDDGEPKARRSRGDDDEVPRKRRDVQSDNSEDIVDADYEDEEDDDVPL